jgi:hypothetical protein
LTAAIGPAVPPPTTSTSVSMVIVSGMFKRFSGFLRSVFACPGHAQACVFPDAVRATAVPRYKRHRKAVYLRAGPNCRGPTCINKAAPSGCARRRDALRWGGLGRLYLVRMPPQFDLVLVGITAAVEMLIVYRPFQRAAGQPRHMQHRLAGPDRQVGSKLRRTGLGLDPQP